MPPTSPSALPPATPAGPTAVPSPPTSLPLSPPSVEAGPRTAAAAPRAEDARLRLLLAAERLYAEQGLEAVSLRHICRAAGNGNNNAVQYHFGGERGLLAAIVAYRVPPLDRRRAELLAAARSRGRNQAAGEPTADGPTAGELAAGELIVRELFDVLMRPLAEEARRPDSWYVGFLSRFSAHPPRVHPWWAGGRPAGAVGHEVSLTILGLLSGVPEPLRPLRLSHLVRLCLTALAEYGQLPAESTEVAEIPEGPENPYPGTGADVSYEIYVADLFDMAAAALIAPASTTATTTRTAPDHP